MKLVTELEPLNHTKPSPAEALKDAERLCTTWRWLYRIWWAVHYAVGIIGIVGASAGAHAATMQELGGNEWAFGMIAAVCTSLITFLGPVQRAERYWKGVHKADHALFAYKAGQIGMKQLVREIADARQIVISGTEPPVAKEKAEDSVVPSGRHRVDSQPELQPSN